MALDADLQVTVGPGRAGAWALHVRLTSAARALALVGPSGSGKSTTLRVLAGLERHARGTLRFGGEVWQDAARFVPPHRRGVGWVPQDGALFPHLSVRGNLAYAGAPADEVEALAERLRIAALLDRRPRHLSGGERQRVALGRALLARPRLLLLDEPFAALDGPTRDTLALEVAALCRDRDLPLIVVSHHAGDVAALAEEVWVLHQGRTERAPPP